jgi:S1 RNA binding domain
MMVPRSICLATVLLTVVSAFKNSFVSRGWSNVLSMQGNAKATSFKGRGWMSMMSDAADVTAVATTSSSAKNAVAVVDFSQYAVGQEYSGSLVGAKAFGVFVDITGINVLLPRSQMTKGNYEKLKRMADSKSKEQVRLELIGVSAENSTLSGKYISANYKNRPDLSALEGTDISTKFFNATVVGAHDFGIFAELDDYGVEGLVPASKLPERMPSGSIQSSYP